MDHQQRSFFQSITNEAEAFVQKQVYTGGRFVASPLQDVKFPVYKRSRIIFPPERTNSWYYSASNCYSSSYFPALYNTYRTTFTFPTSYYSAIPRITACPRILPSYIKASTIHSIPSYSIRRIPGYSLHSLSNYHNTKPLDMYKDEKNQIRLRAQSLISDNHNPLIRRARSYTPLPISRYAYHPSSHLGLDVYVERITNPVRHIEKDFHCGIDLPQPVRKYIGKSHLSSVRICGDKAYNIRRPFYDSDKVRTDINILSWYLSQQGKRESAGNDKPATGEGSTSASEQILTEILDN
ncbi:uncharacterized protein CG45076-like isoform X2 [Eurosta solidaginis]|uniref:uncharacterized protein CG45076-like isoform X2 n=1 Tax=Eurosta solidaginis TaxID=178769 RepID=UPI0035309A84